LADWADTCVKCSSIAKTGEAFEKTCQIEEGNATKDFCEESVGSNITTGYKIKDNYAILWEKDIPKALALGSEGCTTRALGLKLERLPDSNGNFGKGILVQNPDKPWTDVEIFTQVSFNKDTVQMPASSCLQKDQGTHSMKLAKAEWTKRLPGGLKRFSKAPALDDLKKRAATHVAATGEPSDDEESEQEEEEEEERHRGDRLDERGSKPLHDDDEADSGKPCEDWRGRNLEHAFGQLFKRQVGWVSEVFGSFGGRLRIVWSLFGNRLGIVWNLFCKSLDASLSKLVVASPVLLDALWPAGFLSHN